MFRTAAERLRDFQGSVSPHDAWDEFAARVSPFHTAAARLRDLARTSSPYEDTISAPLAKDTASHVNDYAEKGCSRIRRTLSKSLRMLCATNKVRSKINSNLLASKMLGTHSEPVARADSFGKAFVNIFEIFSNKKFSNVLTRMRT